VKTNLPIRRSTLWNQTQSLTWYKSDVIYITRTGYGIRPLQTNFLMKTNSTFGISYVTKQEYNCKHTYV
jgi:hypothetical protein